MYMQDVDTISYCQSMKAGDTIVVYDRRDESDYEIGKLADGNCWMLQNLRLASESEAEKIVLDSTNSNVPATFPNGKTNWELPVLSSSVPADDYTNAKLYKPTGTAQIYSATSSTADPIWSNTDDANKGILYNYAAATAGTVTGNSNTTKAQYDICPKGWHLPSGGSNNSDFGNLVIKYGATNVTSSVALTTAWAKVFNYAFKTVRAGDFYGGSLNHVGSGGGYWSSVAVNAMGRYYLGIGMSDMIPATSNSRNVGRSIRCVAKPIMQEQTTIESCLKLTEGQTMVVIDKRDGKEYEIGKLKDDRCWMLQNLRLGGSSAISLSSADTNISAASWNLPALSSSAPADDYDNAQLYQPTGTAQIYSATSDTADPTWSATDETNKGILYNYAAATAETITGSSNSTKAEYDICPKGWKLPSGGSNDSDFGNLVIKYGADNGTGNFALTTPQAKAFNYAFKTVRAGYFRDGQQVNVGTLGYYWFSVASSTSHRYGLNVNTSDVSPGYGYARFVGFSIRCVAQKSMQEMTMADCSADGVPVYDKRDGKTYVVKKITLNDTPTCWMMSNLQVEPESVLTSDDTNLHNPDGTTTDSNGNNLTYTMPKNTNSTANGWVNDYCKPYMAVVDNVTSSSGINYGTQYYYNWPVATARKNETTGSSSCSNDIANSLGDICPAGWHIFDRTNGTGVSKWLSDLNASVHGMEKTGYFYSGSVNNVGTYGYWWTAARYSNNSAYYVYLNGSSFDSSNRNKHYGSSVRCIRTS